MNTDSPLADLSKKATYNAAITAAVGERFTEEHLNNDVIALFIDLASRFLDSLASYQNEHQTQLVSWKNLKDVEILWERHILDSLRVYDALFPLGVFLAQNDETNHPLNLVDVGSGAGFPSIPCALLQRAIEQTDGSKIPLRWHMIEKSVKRSRFLRSAAEALFTHFDEEQICLYPVSSEQYRLDAPTHPGQTYVLVHRAYSPLKEIINEIKDWKKWKRNSRVFVMVFLGKHSAEEGLSLLHLSNYDNITKSSVASDGSCLVCFEI